MFDKRFSYALVVGLLVAVLAACQPSAPPAGPAVDRLLIRGGTLIDGTGAAPRMVDILVEDGVIRQLGAGLDAGAAPVIEAAGRFIIPGLIDSHAHLDSPMVFQLSPEEKTAVIENNPRAFLYNGVTTVLNVSSDADWIWARRAAQREGRLLAPRIYAMGRSFTPDNGWGSRHGGALHSPEEALQRADDYIAKGTDGFKIIIEDGLGRSGTYVEMPDDILQAIAEKAHAADVPMYIHAINLPEYKRAIGIRPRAIVHGLEDPLPEGDTTIQELADNNVYVVPTLSLFEAFLRFDEQAGGWEDPSLKGSLPGFLWTNMQNADFMSEENRRFQEVARMDVYGWVEKALPIFRENIRKMHEAGIKLGTGTDAGGPVGYNFQGYNTPWELKLLVECGLTPMEALQAATIHGAEIIGNASQAGTVETGKWADLLILTANPLENIENVRQIETVVLNGKPHARQDLAAR